MQELTAKITASPAKPLAMDFKIHKAALLKKIIKTIRDMPVQHRITVFT